MLSCPISRRVSEINTSAGSCVAFLYSCTQILMLPTTYAKTFVDVVLFFFLKGQSGIFTAHDSKSYHLFCLSYANVQTSKTSCIGLQLCWHCFIHDSASWLMNVTDWTVLSEWANRYNITKDANLSIVHFAIVFFDFIVTSNIYILLSIFTCYRYVLHIFILYCL